MNSDIPKIVRTKKIPLEKDSEKRLRLGVQKRGGECYKFSSPQRRGVSDRIVILYGRVIFLEMKREGITKLSPKQVEFRDQILAQDADYCMVSGHKGVDEFLAEMDKNKSFSERLITFINQLARKIRAEYKG